jgi:predicted lipid-binding transport protein (Tim44 family)
MGDNASSGVPQFSTAEYQSKPGETLCKACGREIIGSFYKVNGALSCAVCAQKIREQMARDSHAAFVRGVLFGIGGAILGLILYVAFALITGLVAGIISLAVGYLVGKAIVRGSGGVGGRRYQVAAVLLTYMAVSLAAVPIALTQYHKQRSAQQQAQAATPATSPAPKPAMDFAKALGTLALIGLASPFLALSNPGQGAIGLIILFVGIRIAWRITAGRTVSIEGPFREAVPATPG